MRFLTGLFFFAVFSAHAANEVPEDFVSLGEMDPSIVLEMRYFGVHNFLGRKVAGYEAPKCYLHKRAAEALMRAQGELRKEKLSLKIYDCYRPQRAVNDFVQWARDLKDTKMKKEFYPRVGKERLFKDGYIASKSGHSRGATVDLTFISLPPATQSIFKIGQKLLDCTAAVRFGDNSVEMGTGFDCFDVLAHTDASVSPQARANRDQLRSTLARQGFENYEKEWWHYTLKPEPYPDTYFDFPIR